AVAFSPDGRLAMAGGHDKIIWGWDVETGREVRRFVGHEGIIAGLTVTPDGHRALTVSPTPGQLGGGTPLRLWGVASGLEIDRAGGPDGAGFWCVAVAKDGRRAFTGGSEGSIRLWRLPDPPASSHSDRTAGAEELPGEVRVLRGHSNWIESIATPGDG